MMAKREKRLHVCQSCGYQAPKWLGRCPDCGQWDTLAEEILKPAEAVVRPLSTGEAESIDALESAPESRWKSGLTEFDRILGGGVVPGSLVLIGGDPGIGKSTLMLQVLHRFSCQDLKVLYLSGEESQQQIKLRAERLEIRSENLFVMTGTCIEDIFLKLESLNPDLVAVDSIQTVYSDAVESAPGSVAQLKEGAARFMAFAKQSGTPIFLVGHVTKEGAIAGPKVLEHLVDTVLYFEGDRGHVFRILRSVKNRFGSTNEIGVFEMKGTGLVEVNNPSNLFLQERPRGVPGSVVISCIEGTRPLLVEVQALVGPSPLGMPRRTAIGIDHNRIALLVAVLGKRVGLELADQDIFVNIAGGMRVDEPAADLGIVCAMMSSYLDKPLSGELVVFGEVGLAGEIRGVTHPDLRIKEAVKMGFSRCLMPRSNLETLGSGADVALVGVGTVKEVYDELFD